MEYSPPAQPRARYFPDALKEADVAKPYSGDFLNYLPRLCFVQREHAGIGANDKEIALRRKCKGIHPLFNLYLMNSFFVVKIHDRYKIPAVADGKQGQHWMQETTQRTVLGRTISSLVESVSLKERSNSNLDYQHRYRKANDFDSHDTCRPFLAWQPPTKYAHRPNSLQRFDFWFQIRWSIGGEVSGLALL
jgi:hypothetical protein